MKENKKLNNYLNAIENYFERGNYSSGPILDSISDLKNLKLLGLTIPLEYYGQDVSAMAIARMAELFSLNTTAGLTILAHNYFGVSGILLSKNENLKNEYLPKITKGELLATFALNEESMGYDVNQINTQATIYHDESGNKRYILNGQKTWITNAQISDLYVTFAKLTDNTSDMKKIPNEANRIMCFLVDKRKCSGTITVGTNYSMLGLKGLDIGDVKFENVDVGEEDVIAYPGSAFKLAYDVIGQTRFATALLYNGLIKALIDEVLEKLNHAKSFDRSLANYPLVQERVGRLSTKLYAMQSLTYLVASLKDDYRGYDSELEDGLLRIFNAGKADECLEELTDLVGREAYLTSSNLQRAWADFKLLTAFEGSTDTAKVHVSLTALKSVGAYYGTEIGKMRKPHTYPSFLVDYALFGLPDPDSPLRRHGLSRLLFKKKLRLSDHLHPNHRFMAQELEIRFGDFKNMTRRILHVYAKEIAHHQSILVMLADYAAELFATIAVMGRSSRSFCIGLRNCDTELDMTNAFCGEAWKKMDDLRDGISKAMKNQAEYELHRRIGKSLLSGNEYNIAHPLQKNW